MQKKTQVEVMQVMTNAVFFAGKGSLTRLLWRLNCIYLFIYLVCQYLTANNNLTCGSAECLSYCC